MKRRVFLQSSALAASTLAFPHLGRTKEPKAVPPPHAEKLPTTALKLEPRRISKISAKSQNFRYSAATGLPRERLGFPAQIFPDFGSQPLATLGRF